MNRADSTQRDTGVVHGQVRRTLQRRVEVAGRGLFTGRMCRMTLVPMAAAESGEGGIEFVRTDLPGTARVAAHVQNVSPERRRTLLKGPAAGGGAEIHTVEHVLSALAGLGVTDAVVGLDGPEVPIGDGSAMPFVEALIAAGVCELDAAAYPMRTPIVVRERMVVREGAAEIEALPWDQPGCEMVYELDYGSGSPIPAQRATLRIDTSGLVPAYAAEIGTARTFCLAEEAAAMRKMGMFKGFEPKDLLVIGPAGPIDNAYRFENEPARHKLLDMLGDLWLAGCPILGQIIARRSGHALNHQMAAALAAIKQPSQSG